MAYRKPVAPPKIPKLAYTVLHTGFLAGTHRVEGETVYMPEVAARYPLMGFHIELKSETAARAKAAAEAAKDGADDEAADVAGEAGTALSEPGSAPGAVS